MFWCLCAMLASPYLSNVLTSGLVSCGLCVEWGLILLLLLLVGLFIVGNYALTGATLNPWQRAANKLLMSSSCVWRCVCMVACVCVCCTTMKLLAHARWWLMVVGWWVGGLLGCEALCLPLHNTVELLGVCYPPSPSWCSLLAHPAYLCVATLLIANNSAHLRPTQLGTCQNCT